MRNSDTLVFRPSDKTKRRKAMITIRHIPSNYTGTSENEGPGYTFSCTVQPNAKNNFLLPEVVKCPSSDIVYHEQVSSKQTRVTGLHFLLIGHNLNRDFSAYSCCVRSIEFHGHLSYSRPLFHIISQLTSLEKVHFVIGSPSQLPFFYEARNENLETIAQNVNAKYLNIKVDINNYKTSSSAKKLLFQDIISSVLERSGHCFPNLKNFYVELPCTGKLSKVTEDIIGTKWSSLTGKLMTSYCPFAEALFVVPFRKDESSGGDSNDLDLELLDILIGRPYTAHSSYAYGVPNPFYGPDVRNSGSAVYYGRNYARYFPVERPRGLPVPPAPVAVRQGRNEHLDDRARQERILQILRQQNILGGNNIQERQARNPNAVARQNPVGLPVPAIEFYNNLDANDPRRRQLPNYRPFPYDENDHGDNV